MGSYQYYGLMLQMFDEISKFRKNTLLCEAASAPNGERAPFFATAQAHTPTEYARWAERARKELRYYYDRWAKLYQTEHLSPPNFKLHEFVLTLTYDGRNAGGASGKTGFTALQWFKKRCKALRNDPSAELLDPVEIRYRYYKAHGKKGDPIDWERCRYISAS